jgi:putative spermidine/putrescine transport system substrate-binding protein
MRRLSAIMCAAVVAVACGGSQPVGAGTPTPGGVAAALRAEGAQVNLYWPANANFKQFISTVLVPGFEAYTQKTYGVQVQVNVLEAGGGDNALLRRLQANGTASGFDVDVARTAPSAALLNAINSGLLEPLSSHASLLSNLASIDAAGKKTFTKDGKLYAAPVYRPTMSLFYNSDLVKSPPTSLADLMTFAQANPGRVTYEDPRSTTGTGSGTMFLLAVMHAYADTVDQSGWGKGWDYLRKLQAALKPEPASGDLMVGLFQHSEIEVMPYWNDAGLFARDDLKIANMKNVLIKDGFPIRYTPLLVPTGAAHKTAALLLIQYALSAVVQKSLATMMHQIPGSSASDLIKGLPADTFGFPLTDINRTSFPAYNSVDSLGAIDKLNQAYSAQVLGR